MTEPSSHPPDDARREAAREAARALAAEHFAQGDATGWFERLYAGGDDGAIPWFDGQPNPLVATWPGLADVGPGTRALVVGCGLGDDAELLAARGADVTAFDLSPSAVARCRERTPGTRVRYQTADLREPPAAWRGAFDLVVEVYTLQAVPAHVRAAAYRPLTGFLAPGGRLLVVTRVRGDDDPLGELPFPLLHRELMELARDDVTLEQLEEHRDEEGPFPLRVRAVFRRDPG